MYTKLLKELKARNISKLKLAQAAGIASSDLYNALNGKKTMFPSWKKRIAEALGKAEEDLFN